MDTSDDEILDGSGHRWLVRATVGAPAAVILIWGVAMAFPRWVNLGDRADSINALFAGFAFVGVVIAILLQREELSLQRQELKDTREELRRAAVAQEEHTRELTKQVDDQLRESKENALARQRQSREQFLTARLN